MFHAVGLGERRVYDIIVQLTTLGILSSQARSQRGGGYEKVIRLNLDPDTVLRATDHLIDRRHQIDERAWAEEYEESNED